MSVIDCGHVKAEREPLEAAQEEAGEEATSVLGF